MFKIGDKVSFNFDGKPYIGEVVVIDAYGTFFSDDPSCDVMVEEINTLFKHLPMTMLEKK